jgi:peptide/nickel transport system permease protein
MTVALIAGLFALVLGAFVGIAAAWMGRAYDELFARPVELVQTFPALIVVLLVAAVQGESTIFSLAIAVGAIRWAEVARLVRSELLRLRSEPYVLAARAIGCSRLRLLRRYLLPSLARPVVVSLSFGIVSVIVIETCAAFIGVGLDASWGSAIAELLDEDRSPRTAYASLLMLGLTVLAIQWWTDGLASGARLRPSRADFGADAEGRER